MRCGNGSMSRSCAARARWRAALPVAAFGIAICLSSAADMPAQQPDSMAVRQVMERFTELWATGDAAGVAGLTLQPRISLRPEEEPLGPLQERQTAAMLRMLFDARESLALAPGEIRIVRGAPDQAFTQVTWVNRVKGTTVPDTANIFLELVLEEEGSWRVCRIRLLP